MWVHSLETDPLSQDFSNRVVPYRHDPEPYSLSSDGVVWHEVRESLALTDSGYGVDDFIRTIASRLLTSHEAWLEVSSDRQIPNSTPFEVNLVDGVTQTETGRVIQKLPREDEIPEMHRDSGWGCEIELDPTRMVHATLPDEYPSSLLLEVVNGLIDINPDVFHKFVEGRMFGKRQDLPYVDISEFRKTERLHTAKASLPIGWTARQIYAGPDDQVGTMYFYYWRELRFLHFLASMRQKAEEALRQVLEIAGQMCGFKAAVTTHGVYTPSEVRRVIRKYEAGKISLSSATDIIFEKTTGKEVKPRRVV